MSRHPSRYMPPNIPMSIPRAYYLQDDADFSEGEMEAPFAWAEGQCGPGGPPEMHENMLGGPVPDVTELYRRKPEDQYLIPQEVVMNDEPRYYYRPAALARIPQRRLPIGMTPSGHAGPGMSMSLPHPNGHPGAYYPPPLEEPSVNYEGVVYRSQPQLHRMVDNRNMAPNSGVMRRHHQMVESTPQVSNIVRTIRPPNKAPVTVRTPRFYRRANLYKRPSTLCLQLPHSPDPSCRPIKSRAPPPVALTSPPIGLRYQTSAQQPMTARESLQARQATLENLRENRREIEERRALSARSAPPRCSQDRIQGGDIGKMHREMLNDDEIASNQDEADTKCSELELLLNQYEQIFSAGQDSNLGAQKTPDASRRSSTKSNKAKRRTSVSKIAGSMKPRLPPSLKNFQKQNSSKSSIKPSAEEDRLEIEQMTAEVLDTLLKDLSVSGLTSNAANQTQSNTNQNEQLENNPSKSEKTHPEITAELEKESRRSRRGSRQEMRPKKAPEKDYALKFDDVPTKTTFMQDKDKFTKFTNSSHTSFDQDRNLGRNSRDRTPFNPEEHKTEENMKKSPWTNTKKSKFEDHTALELHRSKSYIVNLIDRALSRELGTIPEERSSKQYLNLDARTAMDLIASKNMDTELCVEISQAIADSFGNNEQPNLNQSPAQPVSHAPPCCSKAADCARGDTNRPEGELIFSTGNEEPLYIKQLKKLRWGHLKHIQREMRRLEDLERFLDSCSSDK